MELSPFSLSQASLLSPLSLMIHSEMPNPCFALIGNSYKMVLLVQYSLYAP